MVKSKWPVGHCKDIEYAINSNDEKKVRELLLQIKGGVWSFKDDSMSPLLQAVKSNKLALVDIVLSFLKMNVNTTYCGETSLLYACKMCSPCIAIISKLLTQKADVNLSDRANITPLMMASQHGNVQIMNLLIEAGANIDAVDNKNRTAVIYVLQNEITNSDALNVLLFYNAKLYISRCPEYNPLAYAIRYKRELVDALIPHCKYEENFREALTDAILTNTADISLKLIRNGAKISVCDMNYLLNRVISTEELADSFYLLWSNINHEYLNLKSFALVFYTIFQQITRVEFFKNCIKIIINTPVLNCNLTGDGERLVISTIFVPHPDKNYDWGVCKDILLEFCEYINKLGVRLKNYDLIIFVKYFQDNCQFITELLDVFLKYDQDLITMYDVIYLSRCNDLNLTEYLLHNCSDFSFMLSRSIYEDDKLNEFSEDTLKFFLQRFTPTKSDTANIRSIEKFDNINIQNFPTLMEIARNALRKTFKNTKVKKLIQNLDIKPDFEDILYFKTTVNNI